jgi:MFS family permease
MNEIVASESLKNRARYAVVALFLAQGLCFSSWASRIPDVKAIFVANLNAFSFWATLLSIIPVGKFIAIPLAGFLVSKFSSRVLVQLSVLGYALSLFAIGLSTSVYALAPAMFCFGVFWNLCDISLNTQAIGIERLFGRPIMATFHGTWSVGACLGALIGFLMIVAGVSPMAHFTGIAVFIAVLVLLSRRHLRNEAPEEKAQTAEGEEQPKKSSVWLDFLRRPEMLLIQLGVMGLFALVVESAMFDWSGVYFNAVLKVPSSLQIGFLVFMVMMAIGRFLTNWAYGKLGKKRVLQVAGFFIFAGFFIAALGGVLDGMLLKVIVTSFGFMLVGLGISCMVPTIYSFVGDKSRLPVGVALTILSSISFIGSLIAPTLIGNIAQYFDMKYAYMFVGVLGLAIWLMSTFCNAFKSKN